jgi:hypothetical protein
MLFQIALIIAAYYLGKSNMDYDEVLKLIHLLLNRNKDD